MSATVVGYGTLIDCDSLGQTLGRAVRISEIRSVIVRGYRRLAKSPRTRISIFLRNLARWHGDRQLQHRTVSAIQLFPMV